MVEDRQLRDWLKEGIISKDQFDKMSGELKNKPVKLVLKHDKVSPKEDAPDKQNRLLYIVSTIGAVLIFVGLAWLVASNWHQIQDFLKVLILVIATLAAFTAGYFARQNDYEGTGRSLIVLGGLLFVLSMFLISQIYHLGTTWGHYATLMLISWVVILLTAYFMDSVENLFVSMIGFFVWAVMQYISSIEHLRYNSGEPVTGLILLFVCAGALLYGALSWHKASNHKFASTYRYWTVFYLLAIFYLLSFQSLLPLISEYSFSSSLFSVFLVSFILICLAGFVFGTVSAVRKNQKLLMESLVVVGILVIVLTMVFMTRVGAGKVGYCQPQTCYTFSDQQTCANAPEGLNCDWRGDQWNPQGSCVEMRCELFYSIDGCLSESDDYDCAWVNNSWNPIGSCMERGCFNFATQDACEGASSDLNCSWSNNSWTGIASCTDGQSKETIARGISNTYEICSAYNNEKAACVNEEVCYWSPGGYLGFNEGKLATSLWLLWVMNNIIFIGVIILMVWHGMVNGSEKIVNLALFAFVLDVITRYIGFWMDLRNYTSFSLLAIFGGILLIGGSWAIIKFRRKLLEKTRQQGEMKK